MRGQIPQLFVFIAALLVIGATVFIGAKLINDVDETACAAGDARFKSELEDRLTESAVFGSRNTIEISVPCSATQICFVDVADLNNPDFNAEDATIDSSVDNGVRSNIFLLDKDGVIFSLYDERVILRSPEASTGSAPLCVGASQGDFTFRTEGFGRFVHVKVPVTE